MTDRSRMTVLALRTGAIVALIFLTTMGTQVARAGTPESRDLAIQFALGACDTSLVGHLPPLVVPPTGNIDVGAAKVVIKNICDPPVPVEFSLGSTAHFSPAPGQGGPYTLQPGASQSVGIEFRPNGAFGFFEEILPVTRPDGFPEPGIVCRSTSVQTVTVQAIDATATEPGTDTAVFRLTRTATSGPLDVPFFFFGGTATSGADFATTNSPAHFNPGAATTDVTVTALNDAIDEDDQTVTIHLLSGTNHDTMTGQGSATVTIVDDDPGPTLGTFGLRISEGKTGNTRTVASVGMFQPTEREVRVEYRTTSGTAIGGASCPGGDYIQKAGTLVFPPGGGNQVIQVTLCGDITTERDETFTIRLLNPVNASVSTTANPAVVTILNDDGIFGTFELTPDVARVEVNEPLTYAFSWTVPEPLNWHDLETMELRLKDGDETVFAVDFDEASGTFGITSGRGSPNARRFPAGSAELLRSPLATLDLSGASVVGSGPTGPSVTLNLPLIFKGSAAGKTFVLEVAATSDTGEEVDVFEAGTVTVLPRGNGRGGDEEPLPGEPEAGAATTLAGRAVPNPANAITSISYSIPSEQAGAPVEIALYDVAGRRVRTLVSQLGEAGTHTIDWNLRNEAGARVAEGIYFYRVRLGDLWTTRKLVVIRP